MKEIAPIVFVFAFGVGNRFSYFMSLFSKNFHMSDGFSSEALIFANSLCELFVYLFLQEVLQMAQ